MNKKEKFLIDYNKDLEDAQQAVEAGDFLFQEEVEEYLLKRRNNRNSTNVSEPDAINKNIFFPCRILSQPYVLPLWQQK